MSTELRKIIVNATSEMLDSPDNHGIYPTSKFYDRLESEVEEYMQQNPNPVNIYDLLIKTVENAEHINPNMQNMIARYLDYQSAPKMTIGEIKHHLGKDIE